MHEATDATGKVQVLVDDQGRVADLRIDQRWRSRLDPQDLPATLFDTYQAARASAARAADSRAGEPTVLATATTDIGEEPLEPLGPGAGHEERWDRIRRIRAQYQAGRERRERITRAARRKQERSGPHGYLTATVRWGGVLGLSGDPRQIRYAETEQLRQDALAVLAYQPLGAES